MVLGVRNCSYSVFEIASSTIESGGRGTVKNTIKII